MTGGPVTGRFVLAALLVGLGPALGPGPGAAAARTVYVASQGAGTLVGDGQTLDALAKHFGFSTTKPWSEFAAMSIIISLPVVIVMLLLQRYIMQGIATTGIK